MMLGRKATFFPFSYRETDSHPVNSRPTYTVNFRTLCDSINKTTSMPPDTVHMRLHWVVYHLDTPCVHGRLVCSELLKDRSLMCYANQGNVIAGFEKLTIVTTACI